MSSDVGNKKGPVSHRPFWLLHIVHRRSPVVRQQRVCRGQVSIDLGSLDPVVPEDDLKLFDPTASSKKICGEGMAKNVCSCLFFDADCHQRSAHHDLQAVSAEFSTMVGYKERVLSWVGLAMLINIGV